MSALLGRPTKGSPTFPTRPVLAFLGLFCVFISSCAVSGLPHPQDVDDADLAAGHERVREMAHHYEVVHIDTSHHERHVRQRRAVQGSSYSHPPTTSFQVNAFGETFPLQLELNTVLLPANFQMRSFKQNGDVVVDRDVVNCYYQGEIAGWSAGASHAVLSTCDGISGSFGTGPAGHRTENGTFFIEPLTSRPAQNGIHHHAVFRGGDAKLTTGHGTCGLPGSVTSRTSAHDRDLNLIPGSAEEDIPQVALRHARHQRARREATMATKYVELLIVVDHTLYERHNSNRKVMSHRARTTANMVDAMYRPLNVRVTLVAVEIFNAGDRFKVSNAAHQTLNRFMIYRASRLVRAIAHDNAQLMTGVDFHSNIGGLAYVNSMCNSFASGGVNQDRRSQVHYIASTMAHEMGHNFGMNHDSPDRHCTCAAAAGNCIMAGRSASTFNRPKTLWSSCSISDLNEFLGQSVEIYRCLLNVPKVSSNLL